MKKPNTAGFFLYPISFITLLFHIPYKLPTKNYNNIYYFSIDENQKNPQYKFSLVSSKYYLSNIIFQIFIIS